MAVGRKLRQVLEQAFFEAGISTTSGQQQDVREQIKGFIVTEQENYADEYDWPELTGDEDSRWFDIELHEGQRFYDWPTDFDWTTLTGVWFQQGSVWVPVEHGITPNEYSAFDSDDDARADPVMKWEYHTATQIEVWPIPASDGALRLAGQRLVDRPVSEDTVMVADDIWLAKRAAASYLRSRRDETGENRRVAAERYAEAERRMRLLKGKRGRKRTKMNFAAHGPSPHPMDPRYRIRVVS